MQFKPETSTKVVVRELAIPLAIGCAFFALRGVLTQTVCAVDPSPCVVTSVNAFDRLAFDYGSVQSDFLSNVFQNTLGTILFLFPLLRAFRKKISFKRAFMDLLSFLRTVLWNFAVMEFIRAAVQRPRPLVFRSPLGDGSSIHQYNSFYSGHTSFTAIATLSLYFYFRQIAPHRPELHRAWLAVSIAFTATMGLLRVHGGRHYPTDTIGGAVFGFGIVLWIYRAEWLPQRKSQ